MKTVETVDKFTEDRSEGFLIKEIVSCPHLRMVNNPLLSTTPNVFVGNIASLVLVVEDQKIKLICGICLPRAVRGVPLH